MLAQFLRCAANDLHGQLVREPGLHVGLAQRLHDLGVQALHDGFGRAPCRLNPLPRPYFSIPPPPCHDDISKSAMPDSIMVGNSGSNAMRWPVVTASSLSLPLLTNGNAAVTW